VKEVLKGTLLEDITKQKLSHNVLLDLIRNRFEYFNVVVDHSDPVILPVVFEMVLNVFSQLRSNILLLTSRLVPYPIAQS
jgi:hypothetical protein